MPVTICSINYPGLIINPEYSSPFDKMDIPEPRRFDTADEAVGSLLDIASELLSQPGVRDRLPGPVNISVVPSDDIICDRRTNPATVTGRLVRAVKKHGSVMVAFDVRIGKESLVYLQCQIVDDNPPAPDPELMAILGAIGADAVDGNGRVYSPPRRKRKTI